MEKGEGWFMLGLIAALMLMVTAFTSGSDTDYWEQIDGHGDCYVHVTQVKNVWFTSGISGPEMRLQFCRR